MRVVFHDAQLKHRPLTTLSHGVPKPNAEQPERASVLLGAMRRRGATVTAPRDRGADPILAVHDSRYLDFLRTAHAAWTALPGAGPEMRPSLQPRRPVAHVPDAILGRAGLYLGDTASVIVEGTWEAAYASAQTALEAVSLVLRGERTVYALCRPPGHHARRAVASGYCYLNNAAIAAEHARRSVGRVAILDIDVHHGDGTQEIFLDRPDVLVASVHADPRQVFPFFTGHADERGEGAGIGFTLNLPVPPHSGDDVYCDAVAQALQRIRAFDPGLLILSLGLDASVNDPFRSMAVTDDGFRRIGGAIAGLGLPLAIVQEGGYLSPTLEHTLLAFLDGLATPAHGG